MGWVRISRKTRKSIQAAPFLRLAVHQLFWGKATDELLGHPAKVNVLVDDEAHLLGVCAAPPDDDDAFSVDRSTPQSRVSILRALQAEGLKMKRIDRRPVRWEEGMVVMDAPELFS